eukprot:TRINITY_DN81762_c0_g1_i1.p2 TRINITY_DN81762_c0_g1~~TRINITY_DN81762_c0_g1_i1.p2  ORF type:complete len:190 (-),score=43.23 TRINITY_DN81762_c0_g1_i1:82-651(-)
MSIASVFQKPAESLPYRNPADPWVAPAEIHRPAKLETAWPPQALEKLPSPPEMNLWQRVIRSSFLQFPAKLGLRFPGDVNPQYAARLMPILEGNLWYLPPKVSYPTNMITRKFLPFRKGMKLSVPVTNPLYWLPTGALSLAFIWRSGPDGNLIKVGATGQKEKAHKLRAAKKAEQENRDRELIEKWQQS